MSGPLDNVDEFRHRPVNAVAGVLPTPDSAGEVVQELQSTGSDVSDIGVLHGEEGARILDRTGAEHGTKAKTIRFFQNWGYDEETFRSACSPRRADAARHPKPQQSRRVFQ